jgi:hypothetical protein
MHQTQIITTEEMLQEIQSAFPNMPMPPLDEMLEFAGEKTMGAMFIRELDRCRFTSIEDDIIRLSRLEFYYLSPNVIRWFLPHYLTYCITAETRLTEELVEFLTYYFNPSPESLEDRMERISALSKENLECIQKFFEWQISSRHQFGESQRWSPERLEFWFETEFEEMKIAIKFCNKAISNLTRSSQT